MNLPLKADLHIHSNYSDGKSSVRDILNVAVRRGLNVISITDHDTLSGSLEAIDIVKEEHIPIEILPGVEISTRCGHLLAYGIEKDIDYDADVRDVIDAVHDLGGLISLAHPFQFYRHGAVRLKYFKIVDCIEVFNARSLFIFNKLSNYFCNRYGKCKTAGSDAHRAEFVGYGLTLIYDRDVMNAMRNRKTDVIGRYSAKMLILK